MTNDYPIEDGPDDDAPQWIDDSELSLEPPLTPRTRPPRPPKPETQSGFVNPAIARAAESAGSGSFPREPGEWWLGFRTLVVVIVAASVSAFIFNYWTPDSFLSDEFVGGLQAVSSTGGTPTAMPSPLPTFSSLKKVGIIAGHSGPPLDEEFDIDPGSICDDNFDNIPELTELSINTAVAQRVANLLIEDGYEVELLHEYDPRLPGYRADVLISIHSNTCQDFGAEGATGFNVEGNTNNPLTLERDGTLAECIVNSYGARTGLPRHFGRPPDLVDYHVFRKISVDTAVVIVELGFMRANRQTLTERPDDMAAGIVEGIECFLNPQQFVPTEIPPTLEG